MRAQLISIGNELTLGQTVDTNAAWLAQQLAAMGIACTRHVTVADEIEPIRAAILDATAETELVLITGGLGPTDDDLTRDGLAAAMERPLEFHAESYAQIEAFFKERGRTPHAANRVQAMIPQTAEPMENTCGTAPGIHAQIHRADIYCMPGVPPEMKTMFERDIAPRLRNLAQGSVILQVTLRTFGMSESELGARLRDLMRRDRNPTVGTSADELIISVRINSRGESRAQAEHLLKADVADVRERLGEVVFGEGDGTLATAAGRLLIERKQTISTAESCTGGLIAKRLTDVPGSSAYFLQGFVTYANDAKRSLLGISEEMLREHGAVSAEVAEAMAGNCRRISGTDYALSATGIAGPTGATPDKPVGLVYVGLASAKGVVIKELRMGETISRSQVRDRTTKVALNLLRLELLRA